MRKYLLSYVNNPCIQVRQGILGYLSHSSLSSTEKPPTSGNYALGDLITALKWIQMNIRHFGGDPDKVRVDHEIFQNFWDFNFEKNQTRMKDVINCQLH